MSLERPEVEPPEGDIPFELGIDDLTVGDGDEAVAGKTVTVHYVGVAFRTGDEFDASWKPWRAVPLQARQGPGDPLVGSGGSGHEGRRSPPADDPVGDGLWRARGRWSDPAPRAADLRGRLTQRRLEAVHNSQLLQRLRGDQVAGRRGVVHAVGQA